MSPPRKASTILNTYAHTDEKLHDDNSATMAIRVLRELLLFDFEL